MIPYLLLAIAFCAFLLSILYAANYLLSVKKHRLESKLECEKQNAKWVKMYEDLQNHIWEMGYKHHEEMSTLNRRLEKAKQKLFRLIENGGK